MSSAALSHETNASPTYQRLWRNLTHYAVEPAMHQAANTQVAGRRSRKQRGGARAATTSAHHQAFVRDWSQSAKELVDAHRHNVKQKQNAGQKKKGKASSKAYRMRARTSNKRTPQVKTNKTKTKTKAQGGFVRDGSVQYFPTEEFPSGPN